MAKRIAGLILAAGYSSRMGELKALLPFGQDNVIANQINCLKAAGISDIYVVVGHQAETIESALQNESVEFVLNDRYSEGMFSSIKTGLQYIKKLGYDGFFLMPVDFPLIQPFTLEILKDKFEEETALIIYPSYQFRKGHPPLVSCRLIDSIIEYDGSDGLKGILTRYNDQAAYVLNGNDTILIDIDTKQDYEEALTCLKNRVTPSDDECEFIFKHFNVSQNIIEHGKTVGHMAQAVAKALNVKGFTINQELVYYAGLLHDFKKGTPLHAEAAAKLLFKMGYIRLAEIIKEHMDIRDALLETVCEETIIYYTDKLLKETRIVPIDDRLRKIEQAVFETPSAKENAIKRMRDAKKIENVLEKELGTDILRLFSDSYNVV